MDLNKCYDNCNYLVLKVRIQANKIGHNNRMSIYYDHIFDIEYLFIFMPHKCLHIQMSLLYSAMGIFCDCSMSWPYTLDF